MNKQVSQDCLGTTTDKGCSSVYAVLLDLKPYASHQGMFWAWAEDFPVGFVYTIQKLGDDHVYLIIGPESDHCLPLSLTN